MPRLSSFNDGYSSETQKQIGINPEYKNSIMLFLQDTAPTGWVRDTTDDDCMLRITTGAISTGGVSPFRTVHPDNLRYFSVDNTTLSVVVGGLNLTTDQIPRHTHNYSTLQEQLSPPMVSPEGAKSSPIYLSGLQPTPPYPYYSYDVWAFAPQFRPPAKEPIGPIGSPYPTTNPADTLNSRGGLSGNQYYPGRFFGAGSGGSHTHTASNLPTFTWQGYWDMKIKYIDAIFAKYTG